MEEMFINPFLIPIVAIVGSFIYVIIRTLAHSRVRELEIRERIAMIERGLVPPPEVDPKGFDRAMSRLEHHDERGVHRGYGAYGGRHRRAGVTVMGVGFGLMVLITFRGTARPSVGRRRIPRRDGRRLLRERPSTHDGGPAGCVPSPSTHTHSARAARRD